MAFEDKLANPTLDRLRIAAREATYPNSTVETKTVEDLERSITEKVRQHENDLVTTATFVHDGGERVLAVTDELLGEMSDLLSDVERSGADASLAARYQNLRGRMTQRIAELERVEREAEFHANKVLDPYGSLEKLRQKYPQIVQGRSV